MKTRITPALVLLLALSPLTQAQVSLTQATATPGSPPASAATEAAQTNTPAAVKEDAVVEAEIFDMTVLHQGQSFDFKHQDWQLLPRSVCAKQQGIKARSNCQKIAKDYFQEACRDLPSSTEASLRYKHKRMYCQAAKTFKPMVAIISEAEFDESNSQKQKCSALIVQAINNNNPYVIARRDRECAKLEQIPPPMKIRK